MSDGCEQCGGRWETDEATGDVVGIPINADGLCSYCAHAAAEGKFEDGFGDVGGVGLMGGCPSCGGGGWRCDAEDSDGSRLICSDCGYEEFQEDGGGW